MIHDRLEVAIYLCIDPSLSLSPYHGVRGSLVDRERLANLGYLEVGMVDHPNLVVLADDDNLSMSCPRPRLCPFPVVCSDMEANHHDTFSLDDDATATVSEAWWSSVQSSKCHGDEMEI